MKNLKISFTALLALSFLFGSNCLFGQRDLGSPQRATQDRSTVATKLDRIATSIEETRTKIPTDYENHLGSLDMDNAIKKFVKVVDEAVDFPIQDMDRINADDLNELEELTKQLDKTVANVEKVRHDFVNDMREIKDAPNPDDNDSRVRDSQNPNDIDSPQMGNKKDGKKDVNYYHDNDLTPYTEKIDDNTVTAREIVNSIGEIVTRSSKRK